MRLVLATYNTSAVPTSLCGVVVHRRRKPSSSPVNGLLTQWGVMETVLISPLPLSLLFFFSPWDACCAGFGWCSFFPSFLPCQLASTTMYKDPNAVLFKKGRKEGGAACRRQIRWPLGRVERGEDDEEESRNPLPRSKGAEEEEVETTFRERRRRRRCFTVKLSRAEINYSASAGGVKRRRRRRRRKSGGRQKEGGGADIHPDARLCLGERKVERWSRISVSGPLLFITNLETLRGDFYNTVLSSLKSSNIEFSPSFVLYLPLFLHFSLARKTRFALTKLELNVRDCHVRLARREERRGLRSTAKAKISFSRPAERARQHDAARCYIWYIFLTHSSFSI